LSRSRPDQGSAELPPPAGNGSRAFWTVGIRKNDSHPVHRRARMAGAGDDSIYLQNLARHTFQDSHFSARATNRVHAARICLISPLQRGGEHRVRIGCAIGQRSEEACRRTRGSLSVAWTRRGKASGIVRRTTATCSIGEGGRTSTTTPLVG